MTPLKKLYYSLVGSTTRLTYWSCSKTSNYVLLKMGLRPKPYAATTQEWNDWAEYNKSNFPNMYWITETGFDLIQDIVYFPYDVFVNFIYWIKSRYIDQHHIIRTNLTPGQYHNTNERIVHGLFNTIVEFVEIEKANKHNVVNKLHNRPIITDKRSAGLAYLDWEISLSDELVQAESAQKIKDIYLWIKDSRNKRVCSATLSGFDEYVTTHKYPDINADENDILTDMLNDCDIIDNKRHQEDNKMLMRIINIRDELWT